MRATDSKLSSARLKHLTSLAQLIRYYILVSTTEAGSGHPTTALSATDLITTLAFGGFYRFDPARPNYVNNDRLVFSKGHAAPLLYALYAAAGKVSETELKKLRVFGGRLEGHPSMDFPYTEAATGSLGQGLSVGLGMALNAKIDELPYRTWVLLGDSEMAEGSVWEALQLAAHYKLDNLIGILDVNRLGQSRATMYGHKIAEYEKRIKAFGWKTIVVDGHDIKKVYAAFARIKPGNKPTMIIAKTFKGQGVSFLADKENWHGKAISKEQFAQALDEMGPIRKSVRGKFVKPLKATPTKSRARRARAVAYPADTVLPTRKAYGNALKRIFPANPDLVVLDAETSNSTYSGIFGDAYPERFFEMFIAEQNMASTALGLSRRGKTVFASSFAAFLSRACDQIRMSQYSNARIVFCGSHAGVAIGEDGASQMALEDLAMFRSILGSVVLYPSDPISCEKLVELVAREGTGVTYVRTTRNATGLLYKARDSFKIGGSKTLRRSPKDRVTLVSAGITLHEALKAADKLKEQKINARVIDLYSVKPVDRAALKRAAAETKGIVTIEDHFQEGGLGEAVRSAFDGDVCKVPIRSLAVRKMPRSGKPQQLLDFENISAKAIVREARKLLGK